MILIYLKDSVLTTQSRTDNIDLKQKIKKTYISMKNVCVLYFSQSQCISRTLFLKKELYLLGAAPNRQNLKAVKFSSGRLLHPPSPVLPICFRIARARPTKILRAITFPKNNMDFNPHKPVTNFFSN